VVVADGQSTDGTPDILKHYSALMGGRLIWCSEPDKGIGDAWNKAVARARVTGCYFRARMTHWPRPMSSPEPSQFSPSPIQLIG
jgi:glycosyltransferase involved in cell wall biosynthesis